MTLRRIVRIWHRARACTILRSPLMRAGGALGQFPFVAEQVREEVVAPLCRGCCPNDFQPATDSVSAFARAELALPPETLLLDGSRFRLRAHERRLTGTMGLAKGVAAGNQRDRFFVVHCHATEGFPNILGSRDGVGLAVWPFRIHVDQTHLHGAERILKVAFA